MQKTFLGGFTWPLFGLFNLSSYFAYFEPMNICEGEKVTKILLLFKVIFSIYLLRL